MDNLSRLFVRICQNLTSKFPNIRYNHGYVYLKTWEIITHKSYGKVTRPFSPPHKTQDKFLMVERTLSNSLIEHTHWCLTAAQSLLVVCVAVDYTCAKLLCRTKTNINFGIFEKCVD